MIRFYIFVLAIIIGFASFASTTHRVPTPRVTTVPVKPDGVLIKKRRVPQMRSGGVRTFMKKIAHMESKSDHRATNHLGMLGLYQFDPRTIRAMGFRVSRDEFLEDPELQDRVMLAFMKDNKRSLRSVIRAFDGQTVNGVEVTTSGILAASHLSGVGGVLSFFYPERYQFKTGDSNGATVAMYMKKFGGFDMRGL